MISFIIGLVGSIMGCVAFFITGSPALLIIGAVLCVVEMLLGLLSGELRTIMPDVIVVIIGVIIAWRTGYKLWVGAALGLCISTLVLSILGVVMMLVAGASMGKKSDR